MISYEFTYKLPTRASRNILASSRAYPQDVQIPADTTPREQVDITLGIVSPIAVEDEKSHDWTVRAWW